MVSAGRHRADWLLACICMCLQFWAPPVHAFLDVRNPMMKMVLNPLGIWVVSCCQFEKIHDFMVAVV